ncbi:hypothetical protein PaG_02255 [Moesziomyces aphidis]|uniref:DOC domain-containing protein n=1 Tax=Moesziomyces aphidis TaxID=84754 RepID=W3VSZ0_MOEAP|nr:hypothetical protein PaG_02255 [Moesziomyces aphidis]
MEVHAVASTSHSAPEPRPSSPFRKKRPRRIYDVDDRSTKVDVGSTPGTSWTLSSYKPGSGVAELRSADLTKLWQSDGNQPHLINIQFARRTCVTHVSIFLDVKQDDSYTPTKIAIKAGTNYHDLTPVRQRTFDTPQGWKHFSMTPGTVDAATEEEDEERDEADGENEQTNGEGEEGGSDEEDEQDGIRLWLLQVCILANHLNGKDTHIRRIVVFGPKTSPTASTGKGTAGALKRIRDVSLDATANSRSKSRTAVGNNGSDVTLAQLLSLQTQADAQGAEEAANADAAPTPPRRSALNLFGSIR